MKKVILSVLVAGSLLATSCKKAKEEAKDAVEATENVANETAEAAKQATEAVANTVNEAKEAVAAEIAGVAIPTFENEDANNFVKEYAQYANDYIAAKGDVAKNELGKKGEELATKAKEVLAKLQGEAAEKFTTFQNAIQAKMHEASTAAAEATAEKH